VSPHDEEWAYRECQCRDSVGWTALLIYLSEGHLS